MKSKMKSLLLAAVAAISLLAPQLSAQQSVAEKYVDKDGFAFSRSDSNFTVRWIEQIYNAIAQKAVADPDLAVADKFIRELWKECNAAEFGVSAISGKEVAADFFVVKQFTAIPAAKRTGFLWKLFPDSKTVPFVDVMPKNSLFCCGFNFNGSAISGMVDHYVKEFGDQEFQKSYAEFLSESAANGVDFQKILNSITGVAFYLEADPARQVVAGFSSAAIIVSVKDRTIMDLVVASAKKNNPDIVTANNEILFPTDFGVLAVFQVGNYIAMTTDPAAAKDLISGRTPSLKQNPDYIKYAAGTPAAGSAFCFVSSELGNTVIPAYLPLVPADVTKHIDIAALCKIIGIGPALYSVSYSNGDGVGSVTNTGSKGIAVLATDPALCSFITTFAGFVAAFWDSECAEPDFEPVD